MGALKTAVYIAFFAIGIYFIKKYMSGGVCTSTARLDGKVVIITGANTGIGKETVKDLAQRGAKVYLGCRSLEKAKHAVEDIQRETGIGADRMPIIHLDLASLKSVREFVKQFRQKENKLDILINNAGVMWVPEGKTEDGFETTFGVNHLGHFLLTHLLMDHLAAVPKSRVISVSSYGHVFGSMQFDDLMYEKSFSRFATYAQSKLANILFTRELAKRLKGTGITTYALHPGAVTTDLQREVPFIDTWIGTVLRILAWPFWKDARQGAQTTICCAVDENLANESGKYYSDCVEKETTEEAKDDVAAKKLWDISVDLVKLDESEIFSNLR